MADYLIVGKKGTGKSKFAVQRIHEYLSEGKRVASNIDIDLAKMCKPDSRMTYIRLPDKPFASDLELIGVGNAEYDEEKNGALVLDEAATWLNARTFNDKSRNGFLDFCVHSRKFGWDMYLICQNMGQIDRQMREALVEYVVRCMRLDKMRIPIVGGFLKAVTLGKWGTMKLHYASTRLMEAPDIKIDGEFYKAKFYQNCYDTRQRFKEWIRNPEQDGFNEEIFIGPYSVLSAWHIVGRHQESAKASVFKSFCRALFGKTVRPVAVIKPAHPLIAQLRLLPADEAMKHYKRLEQGGFFDEKKGGRMLLPDAQGV